MSQNRGSRTGPLMDSTIQQARELHRKAQGFTSLSRQYREQRDAAIRRAYAESGMSYPALARQIGCSPELVAKAVQER